MSLWARCPAMDEGMLHQECYIKLQQHMRIAIPTCPSFQPIFCIMRSAAVKPACALLPASEKPDGGLPAWLLALIQCISTAQLTLTSLMQCVGAINCDKIQHQYDTCLCCCCCRELTHKTGRQACTAGSCCCCLHAELAPSDDGTDIKKFPNLLFSLT